MSEDLKQEYTVVNNIYKDMIAVTSNFETRLHYFIGLFSIYISTVTLVILQIFLNPKRFVHYAHPIWILYAFIIGLISFIIIDLIIFAYFYKSKRRYAINVNLDERTEELVKTQINDMNSCVLYNHKQYVRRSGLFNLAKKIFFGLINFIIFGLIFIMCYYY